jgi:molecular chaperone DnaJ
MLLARNKRDYYEVLGVSRDCTSAEIKQAYRRLARQYHPDVNNGDPEAEEKFKEISEAYAVLCNEEKRRQYDQFGFSSSLFDGVNFDSIFSEFGFGDIFDMFFGSAFGGGFSTQTRTRRRSRGSDASAQVVIDFKEAAFGVKKEVEYSIDILCEECEGKGSKSPQGIITCQVCHGTGRVRVSRDTFLGSLITTSTCGSCNGAGTIIKDPCSKCSGKGYHRSKKKIVLDIPSGIDDGNQLRVEGKGNSKGLNSISGDFIITVKVKPHPSLKRDGDNVMSFVDISFAQAALGTKFKIETLDGEEEIVVKPGTQPGTKVLLKSRGIIPLNGSRRGDHIININVRIPTNLSNEEIMLLKQYAKVRDEIVGDGTTGIFSNLKNAFKR